MSILFKRRNIEYEEPAPESPLNVLLREALQTGLSQEVESRLRSLIAQQPELINASDPWIGTPLVFVIGWSHGGVPNAAEKQLQIPLARILIDCGASMVDPKTGWPAFNTAAGYALAEVIGLLLERGASPRVAAPDGRTPLHIAALPHSFNDEETETSLKLLLEAGADIEARTKEGRTPLHFAGLQEARILLEHGADINAKDHQGMTPLHRAVDGGGDIYWMTALYSSSGANINARDIRGRTPLHWAAATHCHRSALFLLCSGANPTFTDFDGRTPLAIAKRGKYEGREAEYEVEGPYLVRQVLSSVARGANPIELRDDYGFTPLMLAADDGVTESVALLLGKGAAVNAVDHKGISALTHALRHYPDKPYRDIADLLLNAGATVTVFDAAILGDSQTALRDIERLGNLNPRNHDGQTPLALAVRYEQTETVLNLINAGADVNTRDANDWTPLMECSNPAIATILLDNGADINAQSNVTALIVSANNCEFEMVRLLLEHGADPNIVVGGRSAMADARHRNCSDVIKMLKEYGAR